MANRTFGRAQAIPVLRASLFHVKQRDRGAHSHLVIPVSPLGEVRDPDVLSLAKARGSAASRDLRPQQIGVPVFGCAKTGMTRKSANSSPRGWVQKAPSRLRPGGRWRGSSRTVA